MTTETTVRPVVGFDGVSVADVALVGGKGANLGELTRAGFPVPGGFVVTAPAYLAAMDQAGVRARLCELAAAPLGAGSDEAERRADELGEIVVSAPLPGTSYAGMNKTSTNVGSASDLIDKVRPAGRLSTAPGCSPTAPPAEWCTSRRWRSSCSAWSTSTGRV